MNINATLLNYYQLCHRKMWLHYHAIRMEHTSEVVYEGKLIGEESYPFRADKNEELEISLPLENEKVVLTAKIDFFDAKRGIVHETKNRQPKNGRMSRKCSFIFICCRKMA